MTCTVHFRFVPTPTMDFQVTLNLQVGETAPLNTTIIRFDYNTDLRKKMFSLLTYSHFLLPLMKFGRLDPRNIPYVMSIIALRELEIMLLVAILSHLYIDLDSAK